MAAPEIQISKDGLKISYQRYLEDSSAGFIAILCILFAVSNKYPFPFLGHSLESVISLPENIQLFFLVILFLSATPVGIVINAVSWFFFSWQRSYLINLWFLFPDKVYNPFLSSKRNFYFQDIHNFFKIDEKNEIDSRGIYETTQYYEDVMSILLPEKNRIEHIRGLIVFSRNLSFLSFVSLLSILHVMAWHDNVSFSCPPIVFTSFLTFLFILVCSLSESHLCLKILSSIYILCTARGISNDTATPQELIKKIHTAYFGNQSGTASISNS